MLDKRIEVAVWIFVIHSSHVHINLTMPVAGSQRGSLS